MATLSVYHVPDNSVYHVPDKHFGPIRAKYYPVINTYCLSHSVYHVPDKHLGSKYTSLLKNKSIGKSLGGFAPHIINFYIDLNYNLIFF